MKKKITIEYPNQNDKDNFSHYNKHQTCLNIKFEERHQLVISNPSYNKFYQLNMHQNAEDATKSEMRDS